MTENSFDELPDDVKKEIAQLARKGRLHPNSQVADISRAWASQVRSGKSSLRSVVGIVFDVGFGFILGGAGGAYVGTVFSQRRLAKRILKAAKLAKS